jgi:hypothetical protein
MRNAEFLGRGEVLRMNTCTEAAKMWKVLEQTDTVHGEGAAFTRSAGLTWFSLSTLTR